MTTPIKTEAREKRAVKRAIARMETFQQAFILVYGTDRTAIPREIQAALDTYSVCISILRQEIDAAPARGSNHV